VAWRPFRPFEEKWDKLVLSPGRHTPPLFPMFGFYPSSSSLNFGGLGPDVPFPTYLVNERSLGTIFPFEKFTVVFHFFLNAFSFDCQAQGRLQTHGPFLTNRSLAAPAKPSGYGALTQALPLLSDGYQSAQQHPLPAMPC